HAATTTKQKIRNPLVSCASACSRVDAASDRWMMVHARMRYETLLASHVATSRRSHASALHAAYATIAIPTATASRPLAPIRLAKVAKRLDRGAVGAIGEEGSVVIASGTRGAQARAYPPCEPRAIEFLRYVNRVTELARPDALLLPFAVAGVLAIGEVP